MKRFLICILLSVTLLVSSMAPLAQAAGSDDTQQVNQIAQFLSQYGLIQYCLKNKKDQELKPLTKNVASCLLLRVFDSEKPVLSKSWQQAKGLRLFTDQERSAERLTGFEYLDILMKTAGIGISPISEKTFDVLFKKLKLRVSDFEQHVLSMALENGLFAEPQTHADARLLLTKLRRTQFTVTNALANLYQVATSRDHEVTLTVTPLSSFGKDPVLLDVLKEVIATIKSQSYFGDKFDEKKAMEAALKAIAKSLKEDKYIEYYTEDEYKSFSTSLAGSLEGIGAYIEEREDQIIVVSPIEGSPAAKAGLLPGDIITHVNGEETKDLTLQQAVDKIRGPRGTEVKLTIKRDSASLEFTIVRDKITVPALTVSQKDGIEVIKVIQFSSHSAEEMERELRTIASKNPQGILIDLRNNPGGFLNEVVQIANFFIAKDQPIVVLKDRDNERVLKGGNDPIIPTSIPLAVLINKGSASASEILAGVLQAYGKAKIYGETSFGKGTVQTVMTIRDTDLENPSGFKLTTSEYLIGTPNKGVPISIDGIGVKPLDNPAGPSNALLDDKKTPADEALDVVLGLMRK